MKIVSSLKLKPDDLSKPSAIFLIAANLVPLYGVFFLHWDVFSILLLFWMENVIVGVFNVFKMLVASPDSARNWLSKAGAIPFFCVHYGLFTLVHGVFVFAFFGSSFMGEDFLPSSDSIFQLISDLQIGWAILALLISHSVSFAVNYIYKGEYKQATLQNLMNQPYTRVVLLHLTIIFGGFLVMALGSPAFALLVLILLKTFIDILTHLREHRKYNQKNAGRDVETMRPVND